MMLMLLMLFVSMRCHILLSSSRFFFYFCINLFYFIFFSSSFWFVRLLSVISHLASRWRSDDGVEFFSCRASVCECVCSMALRPSARSHFPSSIKPRRKKIVYGRAVVCALCAHPSARSRVKELFTYTHSHRKKNNKTSITIARRLLLYKRKS